MLKLLLKLRNKKGFTLVEVIIVLVILAILAAVMIPSLTGYIDMADEKVLISEARQWLVAAQTALSETYGSNNQAYKTAFANGRQILNKKANKKDFTSYISTQFQITDIDENGKEVKTLVHAGRISNSYLKAAQDGDKTQSNMIYPQRRLAEEILKYMDSGYGTKNPSYKFNSGEAINSSSYLTADKYFSDSKNKNQDVAISIYFDESAKVIMLQYAKRGYSKIVELYSSGYKLVDKVNAS